MAFVRVKRIGNVSYYYLVESKREGGKVRQKILQYFGTTLPEGFVVPTRSLVSKKGIEKAGTTKTMGEVEPSIVSSKVSTTPGLRERTKPRGIRLPVSLWALVEAEALNRGVNVNDIVRERLELPLQRIDELKRLIEKSSKLKGGANGY